MSKVGTSFSENVTEHALVVLYLTWAYNCKQGDIYIHNIYLIYIIYIYNICSILYNIYIYIYIFIYTYTCICIDALRLLKQPQTNRYGRKSNSACNIARIKVSNPSKNSATLFFAKLLLTSANCPCLSNCPRKTFLFISFFIIKHFRF